MRASGELRALGAAVVVVAAAFGGAAGFARMLRTREAAVSHQMPDTEPWFRWPSHPSPATVTRGRRLFLSSCAHCHGFDARGDEGPDLHDLQVSDRYIATTIRRGIKGEMPSFAKKHGPADIAALLAYVRSLAAD